MRTNLAIGPHHTQSMFYQSKEVIKVMKVSIQQLTRVTQPRKAGECPYGAGLARYLVCTRNILDAISSSSTNYLGVGKFGVPVAFGKRRTKVQVLAPRPIIVGEQSGRLHLTVNQDSLGSNPRPTAILETIRPDEGPVLKTGAGKIRCRFKSIPSPPLYRTGRNR